MLLAATTSYRSYETGSGYPLGPRCALSALAPLAPARVATSPPRCPHASEVRTFHGWLAAGRVVAKGQNGICLVAPDTIDDSGKIASIKPVYVFDVTQTNERTTRAAA